jgi:2-C-methyl-D-erythritol 2,4-cyclodiphosphate synthase
MAPHIEKMRENIAVALGCAVDRINVKATTTEELGFAGRGEGIAAYAVALMEREESLARNSCP